MRPSIAILRKICFLSSKKIIVRTYRYFQTLTGFYRQLFSFLGVEQASTYKIRMYQHYQIFVWHWISITSICKWGGTLSISIVKRPVNQEKLVSWDLKSWKHISNSVRRLPIFSVYILYDIGTLVLSWYTLQVGKCDRLSTPNCFPIASSYTWKLSHDHAYHNLTWSLQFRI